MSEQALQGADTACGSAWSGASDHKRLTLDGNACRDEASSRAAPYGGMPARMRPTPEDTVTARHVVLNGLARDADIFDLASELAPLHPRNNTFPGEVFLHLAADALN